MTQPTRLPDFTVGVIGHNGHGKTTLTAALLQRATARYGRPGEDCSLDPHGHAPERVRCYQFKTRQRSYGHLDVPGGRGSIRATARAVSQLDAAIVVVDVTRSAQAQTREHLVLSRAAGISQAVVFLNRCDEASDPAWVDEVEREARQVLLDCGFDGDDAPVVRGSALRAYEGDAAWAPSIDRLLDVIDQDLHDPPRRDDEPPRMSIEEVTWSEASGTIVLGRVEQGVLRPGVMHLVGRLATALPVRVSHIQRYHVPVTEARAGSFVGVSFEQPRVFARTGMTLVKPDVGGVHKAIEVSLRVIPLREWGRHTPIKSGHKGFLHLGAIGVTATLQFPEGVEQLMPGDELHGVKALLDWPIWVQAGHGFMLRDGTDGYRQLKHPKPTYTGKRYITAGEPMMAGMALVGTVTAVLNG